MEKSPVLKNRDDQLKKICLTALFRRRGRGTMVALVEEEVVVACLVEESLFPHVSHAILAILGLGTIREELIAGLRA